MLLHEFTDIRPLPDGNFRARFRAASMPGMPQGDWTVDVTGDALLDYQRFRKKVLQLHRFVFSLFPDSRFARRATTAPMGQKITPLQFDFAVNQALSAGTKIPISAA